MKFPPWWGYGYFLEPHIQEESGILKRVERQLLNCNCQGKVILLLIIMRPGKNLL